MEQANVQDVASYVLEFNDKRIRAFHLQREACEEQMKALTIQREAWDEILEWASSLALLRPKLPTFRKLHSGMTAQIVAEIKFSSGLVMKLNAELEEFSVVQEGIRDQVQQMEEEKREASRTPKRS